MAVIACPLCCAPAKRQIPRSFAFSIDGRISVPLDQRRIKLSKFMDAAGELDYAHKKQEETLQRKIDNPSYFREGVKRAKEVLAGKRAPPREF